MSTCTDELLTELRSYPLILGIDSQERLEKALQHEARIVLTLGGTVGGITQDIKRLKDAGKFVILDIDLVDGLAARPSGVDFLLQIPGIDAILSTKASLLRYASGSGMMTIHRMFIVDSAAFRSIESQRRTSASDIVNIQPGWPKVIEWVHNQGIGPIIASGLVCDWQSVEGCLSAGAAGFCTTDDAIWDGAPAFWGT